MVTDLGESLTVVIVAQTGQDWLAFASWYSFSKNFPATECHIVCQKTGVVEYQLFQWAKRLNVGHCFQREPSKDGFVNKLFAWHTIKDKKDTVLVITPYVLAVSPPDSDWLSKVNKPEPYFVQNTELLLTKNMDASTVSETINAYVLETEPVVRFENTKLCSEAKIDPDGSVLTSCRKGCGRWIDTLRGCPFSSAAGMIIEDMTVNEMRIIELWQKMVPLYSAVF